MEKKILIKKLILVKKVDWKNFWNGKKGTDVVNSSSMKDIDDDLPRKRTFTGTPLEKTINKKESDPFEHPFNENSVEIHSPNPLPKFDFSSIPKVQNNGRYNDVKRIPPLDLSPKGSESKLSPKKNDTKTSPKVTELKISPKKTSPKRSDIKSMDLSPRDVDKKSPKRKKSPKGKISSKKEKTNELKMKQPYPK